MYVDSTSIDADGIHARNAFRRAYELLSCYGEAARRSGGYVSLLGKTDVGVHV